MNRPAEIDTAINNLRNNNITMNEDKLNLSSTIAIRGNKDESSANIPKVNNSVLITTKPKNFDDFVNPDEVNISTRTTVHGAFVENDNPDSRPRARKPMNYAAKKTVAQGMIDIALLTSNANQLKNVIEYQSSTTTFILVLLMIIISLVLQVGVGVALIFKGRYDTKGKDKAAAARVNNWVMSAVFVITVINIFIAVFSTSSIVPQAIAVTTPTPS